ncbi:Target SNARE coiled-coil domain protein [Zostera marina]|uniref:Target SNARE coiled-coil domain protein n=1 Tax=Zostera marina TaxID=29655 RepID=A0A0K9PJN1_ZOSMR|nr:Target SNARE coiled-coil domain protein [Zostera marina]
MANLRSREGLLGARSSAAGNSNSGEIQLRIDPMHADLDEEITGLHHKIKQLKGVALEIEGEAKFQNDFLSKLQLTVIKAQAGLKNNMRRMNNSIFRQGSNHLYHVILFALVCFFLVYLWTKHSRR